jgi:MoaA/NifB/PqqE/SkfB family radical SAM enzyme
VKRPLNVILDLTSRCNLKCIMGYFSNVERLHFPPFERPQLSNDGNLPVETFRKIADDLFPRAWRVALACAAEPMIHPKFREIVGIAGSYGVPDLWFPTNLLALTEPTTLALIRSNVTTVAASIDGITQPTYEKIRVPARWDRLISCLNLFAEVKRRERVKHPNLRIIFTWMKSNRADLAGLPAFAEEHGATELDVRYVSTTVGVDVGPELLNGEDPRELNRELAATAREAVRRGLRLTSYPDFESAEDLPQTALGRLRRNAWRRKAGIDSPERTRYATNQRLYGCAYPDRNYVVRPNGAVAPCVYWEKDPIGFYPEQNLATIAAGEPLGRIRDGLRSGHPVGTCAECSERRDALYRLRVDTIHPEIPGAVPTDLRLPTHPS